MPASLASSTTYWINGLSTIVSISFGIALVAGRKRVPRPATGKTAFLTLFISSPGGLAMPGSSGRRQVEAVVLPLLGAAQAFVLPLGLGDRRRSQQFLG